MILTKDNFKKYIDMDLTDTSFDDVITMIIEGAESLVSSYIMTKLEKVADEPVIEYFDGNDISETIYLGNILNISDVVIEKKQNETFAPLTENVDYYVYEDEARIDFESVDLGRKNYKVTYLTGFDAESIPSDLKIAILKIAGAFWNKKQSDGISSESLEGSVNWSADDIPALVKMTLDNYMNTTL